MAGLFRYSNAELRDDRQDSLGQILQESERYLVQALLDIQQHATPEPRTFDWTKKLMCLQLPRGKRAISSCRNDRLLHRTTIAMFNTNFSYAAVSYCCEPADTKSSAQPTYYILDGSSDVPRRARVRDEVLSRVIDFVQHQQLDGIWIDDECLDKSDTNSFLKAINGMDIVYRRSRVTLGLLEVSMHDKHDLNLLDQFLRGEFVTTYQPRALVQLRHDISTRRLRRLLQLLSRILSDRWWQRCWIFQENHCSENMLLSMPCEKAIDSVTSLKRVHRVGSEIQFRAKDFQTNLTLLCLAARHQNKVGECPPWPGCDEMLRKGRRYDVLHQYRALKVIGAENAPMSALIFADVCERDLKCKENIPAIVANCCNYAIRVNVPSQSNAVLSLSLVLLLLFLLNGDMLTYDVSDEHVSSMNVTEFLTKFSFGQTHLPVNLKKLTFLKRRRWPRVRLTEIGMVTSGHIWRVHGHITTDREPGRHYFDNGSANQFLKPFQRARLRQLASALQELCPELSHHICRYLDEMSRYKRRHSQRAHMMRTMAKKICQAVKKGRRLLLATLNGTGAVGAIFVCPRPGICQPLHVVTSWDTGHHIEHTTSMQTIEKYVSIVVERHKNNDDIWIPRDWIHGLCFFEGLPQQKITVPWPDYLNVL